MVHRKIAAATLAAALVLVGAGCGGSDDNDASDEAADKLAEELLGDDVEIDSENDSVKITDDDGNTTEYGTSADLPEGWPEELNPPDSVTIQAASTQTQDGVETLFVTGESEDSMADLYEGVKTQLTDAGYEITSDSNMTSDTGGFASLEASNDTYTVSVTLSEDTTTGKSIVLFNVSESAA
jgi:hypothetical protein